MMSVRITPRTHAGALLALGLPIAGSHLAGFFIHVTDTVMLGWYGVEELAAVVIGGAFWFLTAILGSGFGNVLPALVATARAAGDEAQVRRATRMAIWLTLGYCALIAPVYLFAEQILLAVGQEPQIAAKAAGYVQIAGFSVVPFLLINLLRSYLAALGRPGVALVATVVGFAVHALVNWALIFGNWGAPELGIRGAAISTLCSDSLICLVLGLYALRRFPQYELLKRFWRPDPEAFWRIFALGWPISLQLVAEVGLFTAASAMMGWVSEEMLAAHGIALQLASTTFLVHLGLSSAATIRAGQAAGLHDAALLRDGALVAVLMSAGFAVVTIAVFLAIPAPLVSLFLDPADPAAPRVIAAGVSLVTMAAVFQLFDGGQAMAIGLLRGVQDTRVPMVIAAVGYWLVGLPVAYVLGFPLGFGGVGVWSGLVIGLFTVWAALSWRFWLNRMRHFAGA